MVTAPEDRSGSRDCDRDRIGMGNLATLLQHRFREACPPGWICTPEHRVLSPACERELGFAPRADLLLARKDGSRRLWIEFEVSRADPVANHAKFAAAHLFEPQPKTDAFISMMSAHVARGRANLAATAVHLMRAVGMSAFQTVLLPSLEGSSIRAFNGQPFKALLAGRVIDAAPEIERAIAVSTPIARAHDGHSIHFAANVFEVMLNVRAWNAEIRRFDARQLWGRRTVTFFTYDPLSQAFAPSKFCAFVPIHLRETVVPSALTMNLATYATLGESETRFDGHIAQHHLTRSLGMRAVMITQAGSEMAKRFRAWHQGVASAVALHKRGPVLMLSAAA